MEKENDLPNNSLAPVSLPPTNNNLKKNPDHSKKIIALVIAIIVVASFSVAAFAHTRGLFKLPFLKQELEPNVVLGKMFAAVSNIESAKYDLNLEIKTEQRDADASPFFEEFPEVAAKRAALQRDQQRMDDISILLTWIKRYKQVGGEGIYYPRTLLEVVDSRDQARIAKALEAGEYGYRQENDGTSFLLAIQLETEEAAWAYHEAVNEKKDVTFSEDDVSRTIELNEDSDTVFAYVSASDASPFPLSFQLDELYQYIPVDLLFTLHLEGRGEVDEEETSDGEYGISGLLKMSGTTLEGGGDIIKHGEYTYVRINEFPSLGFFDLAALKGQWVRINSEDMLSSSLAREAGSEDLQAKSDTLVKQYRMIFQIAAEENVMNVVREYPREKIDGQGFYRYEIDFDRESLISFYRRITEETKAEFGDDAIIEYNDSIIAYLESEEFAKIHEALRNNITIEIWINDTTFYPSKISYSMRFVPPNSIQKFANQQIRASIQVGVSNINESFTVTPPAEYISMDEAQVLLSGKTEDEVLFERQISQILSIRSALARYQRKHDVYPESLESLLTEEEESPFLTTLPNDVYTQQQYQYSNLGDDFHLQYQVSIPVVPEDIGGSYNFQQRMYDEVAQGLNTATSQHISLEGMNVQ